MGGAAEQGLSRGKWMALTAALLGWMFDGLEMGLFPLVARPAVRDLERTTDDTLINLWFDVATAGFLVGAATGGVLFGWLGDRIGRVRAMTLSVLVYALFSGMCGFAWAAWQVAALRFIAALGMGGEWSLGVALVMEIWPNRSRGLLAGMIGAAANVGFTLIALVDLGLGRLLEDVRSGLLTVGLGPAWVETLVAHSGWRLLMFLGATPALLTFFIRLFVPESKRWQHEQQQGSTSHWATRDLAGVLVGASAAGAIIVLWAVPLYLVTPLVTLAVRIVVSLFLLVLVTGGYLYPILRYLQRTRDAEQAIQSVPEVEQPAPGTEGQITARPLSSIAVKAGQEHGTWLPTVRRMLLGACLSGVALLGTWASLQRAPTWADQLVGGAMPQAKAYTQIASGIGAILGTIAGALLGDWLGRRAAYTLLCASSLGSALLFFQFNHHFGWFFLFTVFLAGGLTASFYGWLPLYLPELFRTRVRATGQGFSFNFGRILAAVGVLQTANLMGLFGGNLPKACSIMSLIYLVGMGIIWLAPETRGKPLPE